MSSYYVPSAEEIKDARLSAKLTQQDSAHMCLVSANSWARYEQGVMKMSAPIWELFIMKVAQLTLVQQEQPKKLTVYEQRRLDKQREAEIEAAEMRKLMQDWQDEPKTLSEEDLAYERGQRLILNNLRIHKEMMITKIEEKSPRNGVEARSQFPDYDNIQIPMVQEHIKRLTPMYNSVKDS